MTDRDVKDMILRCVEEIEMLRRQVAILQPKADAYCAIEQILGLLPQRSTGAGEDIVWRLKRQLRDLEPPVDPSAPVTAPVQ